MTHEELEEAVPLYAVGALDRPERQAFEAHLLSGCQSCHNALKDYQSVASLLPFGLSSMQAPRGLKARIMAARHPDQLAVDNGEKESARSSLEPGEWMNHLFPPESSSRATSFGLIVGLVTIAVLAIGSYLAWNYYTRIAEDAMRLAQLQAQADATSSKLIALQQQLSERETSLAQMQEVLQRSTSDVAELKVQLIHRDAELEDMKFQLEERGGQRARTPQDELAVLLRTPQVKAVALAGTDMAKQAAGMLLYDARSQKVWLYSVNLPESPNGTTYQLWAIHEKPISVGLFHLDSGETANLLVKSLPNFMGAKKFAVSLEPPGGRAQPTGPLYLVSHS